MKEEIKCTKCGAIKKNADYYHYTHNNGNVYHHQPCKSCHDEYSMKHNKIYRKGNAKFHAKQYKIKKNRMEEDGKYKKEILKQKRSSYKRNITTGMLNRAKQRAKKTSLEFSLTKEDIVIPELCPILGIPFVKGSKGNYSYSPSLDRKDPTKGYTRDNVGVITTLANTMKNKASLIELKAFSKNIIKYME